MWRTMILHMASLLASSLFFLVVEHSSWVSARPGSVFSREHALLQTDKWEKGSTVKNNKITQHKEACRPPPRSRTVRNDAWCWKNWSRNWAGNVPPTSDATRNTVQSNKRNILLEFSMHRECTIYTEGLEQWSEFPNIERRGLIQGPSLRDRRGPHLKPVGYMK